MPVHQKLSAFPSLLGHTAFACTCRWKLQSSSQHIKTCDGMLQCMGHSCPTTRSPQGRVGSPSLFFFCAQSQQSVIGPCTLGGGNEHLVTPSMTSLLTTMICFHVLFRTLTAYKGPAFLDNAGPVASALLCPS